MKLKWIKPARMYGKDPTETKCDSEGENTEGFAGRMENYEGQNKCFVC